MKKTFYTIIALFFAFQMNAQSNFKPGKVIFNNQETVPGDIDYKQWDLNPKSISFRKDKGPITLTTRDISGFTLEDMTYERGVVNNKYSGRLRSGTTPLIGKPSKMISDTVFLLLIAEGEYLNLYEWEDLNTMKFYVRNNNTHEMTELIVDQYWDPDNITQKVTTKKYVGQFSIFANDPQAKNKSKVMAMTIGLLYEADQLTAIVDELNGKRTEKVSKSALKPYAGVAVQGSTIAYSGGYALPNPKMSILPALNLGLDLYPNYQIKKYKIRFNFGFSAAKYESGEHSVVSNRDAYDYHHEFSQYTISFTPQFIINFYNSKKIKINAGTGFMLNYSFYPTNKYTVDRDYFNVISNSSIDYDLNDFWFTIPVRAGITLNDRIDLFAQYCPSFISALSNNRDYKMNTSTIQLGVNICF